VIILSVFNGFEGLVLSLYNSITPELVIEPAQGKTFDPRIQYLAQLKEDPRVTGKGPTRIRWDTVYRYYQRCKQ
jgi:hypothetical protein